MAKDWHNNKQNNNNNNGKNRRPQVKSDPITNGTESEMQETATSGRGSNASTQNNNSTTQSVLNLSRNLDSQLSKDVTNFPFAGALGRTIDTQNNTFTGNEITSYALTVPGICAFEFYPSIGSTLNFNSPVNLSMRNLYSFVTHANSRNASYAPTDLMIYILATSNLFMMWNNAVRAYGIAKTYSATNRYLAETLIQACGFNPDDIMLNLNDFRGALNIMASKLSSLVIPSTMGYTLHTFNMCSEIYADSENSRAQLYLFRPAAYWQYDETAYDTGGALITKTTPTNATVGSYITMLNSMANSILGSKFMNIMAADIMKAFGSNLYSLSEVTDNYWVIPSYSDAILETINNIVIAPRPVANSNGTNSNDVYQTVPTPESGESPYLSYAPMAKEELSYPLMMYLSSKKALNTNYETLTPAQVVDRTNFSSWGKYFTTDTDGKVNIRIQSRTEIITRAVIYAKPYAPGLNNYLTLDTTVIDFTEGGAPLNGYIESTVFNKFPLIWGLSHGTLLNILGDIDNIAFIDLDDMESLDDTIMQIIFNVDTVYPGR